MVTNTPDKDKRNVAGIAAVTAGSVRSRVRVPADGQEKARQARVLKERYAGLLKQYLHEPQEEVLLEVYRLGRSAVAGEVGLLAMAELHHEALREVLAGGAGADDPARCCARAGTLLSELLSPYEMSSRGYREASTAMRHLNEMLEDEVRRIAHAIHDGAGQYLACVHISLYSIAKHLDEDGKKELKHAHGLLDELERDLRDISHELRPRVLENSGLAGAVDFLVDSVSQRTGLEIHVDNALASRPPAVIETAVYRCIQEMLNNITKHAEADNAWIHLREQDDCLLCEVRDDGVGFNTDEVVVRGGGGQLGFLGIRERIAVLGGSVEIDSAPGKGARIAIQVPR